MHYEFVISTLKHRKKKIKTENYTKLGEKKTNKSCAKNTNIKGKLQRDIEGKIVLKL